MVTNSPQSFPVSRLMKREKITTGKIPGVVFDCSVSTIRAEVKVVRATDIRSNSA